MNAQVEESGYEHGGGFEPERGMAKPLVIGALVQMVLALGIADQNWRGWAEFLGRVTGTMLIPALVLYFAFGRHRDPEGWWKIPLVLWPIAFVAMLGAAGNHAVSYDRATNNLADAGRKMLASDGTDPGELKHSGTTGEAGEFERVLLAAFRTLAEDRRNYEREFTASGIQTMLAPDVLRRRADLPAARRKVEVMGEITARYRALHASRIAEFPERFRRANVSESARRDALEGFEQSLRESNAEHIWSLEAGMIQDYAAAVTVLERGNWQRQGEQFLFSSQADLAAFNAAMSRIDSKAIEQERLIALQQQRTRASLDSMTRGRR
jgi:hypothetical protein